MIDTLPLADCIRPAIAASAPKRRPIVAPRAASAPKPVKRKRLYRVNPVAVEEDECEKPALPSLVLPVPEPIEAVNFTPVPPATFEQLASDEPEPEQSGGGLYISQPISQISRITFAPPVPEPAVVWGMLAGLGALVYRFRRTR